MSLEDSIDALRKAEALERQLLFSEPSLPDRHTELRLLGFCMAKLGRRDQPLQPLPEASILALLNHNNIHHRRVETPRRLDQGEFPLLIVFEAEAGKPLALYRRGRRNWLYDPERQCVQPVEATTRLEQTAYEVYPSLPPQVDGPLTVLRFAFATEVTALAILLITSALVMVFNLAIPTLTNLLVSRILPENDQQLLMQGFTVVVFIVIGSLITQYMQNLMLLRIESVADLRLQSAVWDRVMRLPMAFISRFSTADLASRVNAISQLRQLLGAGVLSTLVSSLFAFSYFVLMFVYDSELAVWASAFSSLSLLCILVIAWRAIQQQVPLQEAAAEITNFSWQAVMGMPQIRTAGVETFVLLRWLRSINRYALMQVRSNVYNDALEQYSTLISPISSMILFALLMNRLLSNARDVNINITLVAFVSFYAAFNGFNAAINGAMNLIASVAGKAAVLWHRAEPVMFAQVEQGYQSDAIYHNLRGAFSLRGISFQFENSSEPLFSGLSFSIQAGQHTAITGPSGCGKTTLVRMLLGFVVPQAGELLVDAIPLQQLAIRAYRRQLGVVMQSAGLTNGSIYDVICGGVQRSEAEVWSALEQAAIADEVRAMPMQLETMLSEAGSNLSGGQVQRIAIARALITKPKVLILDEATSALDNRSQQLITRTIENLGITRISIAHRLSTIQQADQIVVLERGKPAETGCWTDLRLHGFLQRMLQSR